MTHTRVEKRYKGVNTCMSNLSSRIFRGVLSWTRFQGRVPFEWQTLSKRARVQPWHVQELKKYIRDRTVLNSRNQLSRCLYYQQIVNKY